MARKLEVNAQDLFEAVGARLHNWNERDYEINDAGIYTHLEVRKAYAMWKVAITDSWLPNDLEAADA